MTATVSAHMLRYLDRAQQSYCGVRCCGRSWFVGPADAFASKMADPAGAKRRVAGLNHTCGLARFEIARKYETQSIRYVGVNVYDKGNDRGSTTGAQRRGPMTWAQ